MADNIGPYDYVKKRLSSMEASRNTWEDHWQEILDYVMPRKADVTTVRSKGQKRTEVLFDSTAITANTLLAASLQGTLTSPSLPWFSIKLRDKALNEDRDTQLWLEDTARRMYDAFNDANFNTEVHEMYLDLTSIGTGCLFVEESIKGFEDGGVHFKTLHINEYYIQENVTGYIDTVYRKYKMSARQAVQEFGEDNLGEKVIDASKQKPEKEFVFIHAVEPSIDYKRATGKTSTKLPFHSCHVCQEDKMVVRTGGYNEFPYLVPRWSKATSEIYGRSPSYNALPDIKTLNKAVEIGLKAWAKAIDPPLLVQDDGVIGRVRTTPAGITVVRHDGAVKPLVMSSNWQVQSEFLNPLIERVFGIMLRSGAILPPPEIIQESKIDIEYVGPLARSQRMEEANAIDRLYQLAMNIAQVDPSVMDNINHDEAVRLRATLLGVPNSILVSKDNVEEKREAQAQAQQQQQQMMMQQQQAQVAKTGAEAMKTASDPDTQANLEEATSAVEGMI